MAFEGQTKEGKRLVLLLVSGVCSVDGRKEDDGSSLPLDLVKRKEAFASVILE
jgi:hypothetical protein